MCDGKFSGLTQCDNGVSRRQFITRSALVGAGLATAPLLLGQQPAEAWSLFPMPSVSQQKQVGAQAAQQVLQQYHEINDSRARELRAVCGRLVGALNEPDRSQWDWRFHMLDSKQVNAFALPGGNLFFFTGLYNDFTTEDELAGVCGHEMTHVRLQHWAKAYQAQQERDTFLGIGLALLHAGNMAQSLAGLADQAIGLKYSRGEEAQADQGGIEDMVAAGYNPQGMVDMFNVLLKQSGNGSMLGGDFLSNHPLTTTRIRAAQAQIASFRDQRSFPPERPIGSAANA